MDYNSTKNNILSKVHIGGLNFGTQWNVDNLKLLLKKTLNHNITNFEVAPLYGDNKCIETFDEAICQLGYLAEKVKISYKYGLTRNKNSHERFGVEAIKLSTSLIKKKLNLLSEEFNYGLNSLQLHCPIINFSDETVSELVSFLKFKHLKLGVANHSPLEISYLEKVLKDNDTKIDFAQFHFNFYQQALRKDILHQSKFREVWINRVIARGVLTNSFFECSENKNLNNRRHTSSRIKDEILRNRDLLYNIKPYLLNLSKKSKCPLSILMIYYCLKSIPNSRVIVSVSALEQIEQFIKFLPLLKDDILLETNEITNKFMNSLILEPSTFFER